MGKKLSGDKNAENMYNIMQFTNGEFSVKAHVSVYVGNKRLWYFNNVNIRISNMPNYYNVNIPWEDLDKFDYRDLGLFGYYSTGYNEMYYSEKGEYLRIESSDSNKVIVLDIV